MPWSRRQFLQSALALPACSWMESSAQASQLDDIYQKIDQAAAQPVLKRELFTQPIIIDRVELLRYQNSFLCRVRSKDGAEGISVCHNDKMKFLYPLQVRQVQPVFHGKDARDLDTLLDQAYVYQSNYKMQSLALWIPVAQIEFALLDMLGKIANKSMGQLIGNIVHQKLAIYRANNFRGRSAEESIKRIKQQVDQTGAKAVKFKLGGRMMQPDRPLGRTEKLIPLVRQTFGDDMIIYADANGSYDVREAIRIGKTLQENNIDLYEEPVPFDWYEETKRVADALEIPLAGGEQESSMRNFRWLIGNRVHHVYQQDLFYFGGMIRCMKVARMANAVGLQCTPHISGTGLGYLYLMHFVSALPNANKYHEFKGFSKSIPFNCPTSSLKSENGEIKIPSGPGSGIELDHDFVAKHKPVKA